jgi:two-component system, chemotaxis family, sensor kinase CheA
VAETTCRELVDELVTLCLSGSLDQAEHRQQTDQVLLALELSPELQNCHAELQQLRTVREKLAPLLQSAKAPTRRLCSQLGAQLEELSHALYSVADPNKSRLEDNDPTAFQLPPEVGEELFLEFLSNARLALDDLEQEIEQLRKDSVEALAVVKRRIHSLKGEAGMLGLTDLEHVLHQSESFLAQPAPTWDRADRLLAVRDWAGNALMAYANHQHPTTGPASIVQLLEATSAPETRTVPVVVESESRLGGPQTERQPTAVEPPRIVAAPEPAAEDPNLTEKPPWAAEDEDLVIEFLHEVDEHLASVDQILIDTEQSGIDAERVNRLFGAFHSLKGVASCLHLQQFAELTHTTETMLDRIRTGQPIPTACVIDMVFDATTVLRDLAKYVEASLTNRVALPLHETVEPLLLRMRQVLDGNTEGCTPVVEAARPGERLGEILVRQGVVDEATVSAVVAAQKATGHKVGQDLVSMAQVPARAVAHALRAQQKSNDTAAQIKEVVKVDLERVDSLVEAIGELVIVESMVSNAPEIRQLPVHLRNYLGQFAKITRELQELGMFMRMVPVRGAFQKMMRIMRDLAHRSNKMVRMELAGEGTEMDRIMVEQIADPLVHLIRNAVDHGIEPAEERRAAGKSEIGTIRLSACHEGGSIIIEISDDGRGINRERVLAKAKDQGIIDRNASLSDAQIFDLLFAPGFSTAQQVTEISGRGVGMDVVKRNIEAVRGRIITSSTPGKGTTFRLVLPLTLAIIDGMVIRCGAERFILPTLNIIESLQPSADMLFSIAGTHEHILVRGQTLPLVRLDRLLSVPGAESDPTKALVIIVESLRSQIALLVDEVVMKQQVVIKTLSNELDSSRIFAGAAILSNGRVGLIVNIESLIDASRDNSPRTTELHSGDGSHQPLSLN